MRNDAALFGMGTTIAGVMLGREDALCFNVGDSCGHMQVVEHIVVR
jgi:serine/threonine protein phosphatase PrpC